MLEQAQQHNTSLPADEHYSYDGVGNRLTDSADASGGSWQYNANHQLTARPDISYGYDANGHTVSKTAGAEVTTYEYDIAERMSAVKRDGVTLGSYQYDPFGRRVKKVTSAGAVYFHYDDTGLLAEYDASGQLISEYQYQPGNHWMTHPLFKRDGATGKVHYYYNSHLGQPLKLFDKAGRTTWSARSQAFGETDVVVNETANPLRFPGQYEDGETGLYYNYHRYYDAETGRYVSADPLGLSGDGPNVYLYVLANPLTYIDPKGLFIPIAGGVVGAVIGGVWAGVGAALSGGDVGKAVLVGAVVGGIMGATGGQAGVIGSWILNGGIGGALSGGAEAALTGGSVLCGVAIGAVTGAVAGGAGHMVAWRNATSRNLVGRKKMAGIGRGDLAGNTIGAAVSQMGRFLPDCEQKAGDEKDDC